MFSGYGLKPPASGFQSYSYSSLRLLHLYSTDDKTSRLKMKSSPDLGTPREVHIVTWRREEKREEGDRGDQEEKRGNQKGREQASQ